MSNLVAPGFGGGVINQPDEKTRVAPLIGAVTSHTGLTVTGIPGAITIEFITGKITATSVVPLEFLTTPAVRVDIVNIEIRVASGKRPQIVILAG